MRIVLAAFAAAVVMFFWGFLFWAVLFQAAGVAQHSAVEGELLSTLSEALPETGVYFLPSGMGEDEEDFGSRHEEGPIVTVFMRHQGAPLTGADVMLGGFVHMLVVTVLMALLFQWVSPSLNSFGTRLGFVAFAGTVGTLFANFSTPIWFYQPWGFHVANCVYMVVAWTLTGVVFALILAPRASDAPESSD